MVLAAVAAFAGASVQSATGFGFALVLGPALFAVLDPAEAVGALLLLGLALNVLMLADSAHAVRGRELVPLLAGALPGLVAGVAILAALSKPVLQVAVGVAVIVAVLVRARSRSLGPAATAPPAGGLAVGLLSGALTTSTSVNGPPLVLWLERQGLEPGEMRSTLAAAFLALNAAGLAVLVAVEGAGGVAEPGELLPLLALTGAGYAAGAAAFRRLDSRHFRVAVLVLVAAAGAASVVAGLAGA